MNIILCGFMGSGKTVVGRELSNITGRKFIDTDELISRRQGTSISAIFATHGEEYFRELEYQVCKEISDYKNTIISTGGGALTFQRNVDALKNPKNTIVFLNASFDVICLRIGNKSNRPLFKDIESARKLYYKRLPLYQKAADITISGDLSAHDAALKIAQYIKHIE